MTKKHKRASARSRKAASPPTQASPASAPNAAAEQACIHHLTTCAVLSLPKELRTILGEEGYARCVKDFEDQELAFLIHIDGDVIYLNSQLILLPHKPAAAVAA